MRKFSYIFIISLLTVFQSFSFDNSNLPIVIIRTDINPATKKPYEIIDASRVMATMKLISGQMEPGII